MSSNSDDDSKLISIHSEHISMDGKSIDVNMSISSAEQEDFSWVRKFRTTARADGEVILSCSAILINKHELGYNFWRDMEKTSRETKILAFDLFDRTGQFRRIYMDHEIKKGKGKWGTEMDERNIFLIDGLFVEQVWRPTDLAIRLMKKTIELAEHWPLISGVVTWPICSYLFTCPDLLTRTVPEEPSVDVSASDAEEEYIQRRHADIATVFWRSIGFRRVGDSAWLAYSTDNDHLSRQLPVADDYDPPGPPDKSAADSGMTPVWSQVFDGLTNLDTSDNDCIARLDAAGALESVVDDKDNTVLHVAAITLRLSVVRHILAVVPSLVLARNRQALTPLEHLSEDLHEMRTRQKQGDRTVIISDRFQGFSAEAVECLCLLTGTQYQAIKYLCLLTGTQYHGLSGLTRQLFYHATRETETQALSPASRLQITVIQRNLRLMFGCSCGACVGGFLSPRMCFHLYWTADEVFYRTEELFESPTPYDSEKNWSGYGYLNGFFPSSILDKYEYEQGRPMSSSLKDALFIFAKALHQFALCLKEKKMPLEENIILRQEFIQQGGTLQSLADVVFKLLSDQGELAGEQHERDVFQREDEYTRLVFCRNDYEFGFVHSMLLRWILV